MSQLELVTAVPVSGGLIAVVDPEDAWVLGHKWHRKAGKRAGVYYAKKSVERGGSKNSFYLHQCIVGPIPKGHSIDHINGNPLDNRRANLRIVTVSENNRNREGQKKSGGSRFTGVWRKGNRWRAEIWFGNKKYSFGGHPTEEAAHKARLEGERKLWGIVPRRAHLHGENNG